MKRTSLFAIASLLVATTLSLPSEAKTVVRLKDANGKSVGTAIIWESKPGVGMQLNLANLPPGEHALHFHQNAKCDAPDFKSAGPHFNPDGKSTVWKIPRAITLATCRTSPWEQMARRNSGLRTTM